MIKAIIFDVDGVLLDSADAVHIFLVGLLESFGYPVPPRDIFREHFHLPMRDQLQAYTGVSTEEELEKIWQAARVTGVDYNLTKAPKDCAEIIAELRKKYPMGIVSNKLSENMWKGDHMGAIKPHFEIALGADDVQNRKPHPEPLLLVAKKLGVAPEECVFIGDMESDFQAGRAAGMKVIMFGNKNIKGADGYTESFLELPTVIESL